MGRLGQQKRINKQPVTEKSRTEPNLERRTDVFSVDDTIVEM